MRKITVIIVLIIINISCYSQDIIIRTNGVKIICDIQKEDSSYVYFNTYIKDQLVETYLNKSEISSLKYSFDPAPENGKKEFITKAVGMGLDYGGIVGVKLSVNVYEYVEIFGGLGWAFMGFGYNVGAKLDLTPESKFNSFLQVMYGYNAVVIINNESSYDKTFYGGTVGFGLDFKSTKRKSYWTIGIQIPFRKEVSDYIDYLKDEKNVEFQNELYPIAISIGYTF